MQRMTAALRTGVSTLQDDCNNLQTPRIVSTMSHMTPRWIANTRRAINQDAQHLKAIFMNGKAHSVHEQVLRSDRLVCGPTETVAFQTIGQNMVSVDTSVLPGELSLLPVPFLRLRRHADNVVYFGGEYSILNYTIADRRLCITQKKARSKRLDQRAYVSFSSEVPQLLPDELETQRTTFLGSEVFIRRVVDFTFHTGNSLQPIAHLERDSKRWHVYPKVQMLNDFLAGGGRLSVQVFLNMLASRNGCVHGDLRRSNISVESTAAGHKLRLIDDFNVDGSDYSAVNDMYYGDIYRKEGGPRLVENFSEEVLATLRIMADISGAYGMGVDAGRIIIRMTADGVLTDKSRYYMQLDESDVQMLAGRFQLYLHTQSHVHIRWKELFEEKRTLKVINPTIVRELERLRYDYSKDDYADRMH